MFSSCDQVQMKLTQLELNSSKLATNAECLGKRGREGEREREGGRERPDLDETNPTRVQFIKASHQRRVFR